MAELLLERVTTLAPHPASAAVARRFVRDVLVEGERAAWVERAELAVSELVTNAIVHAGSQPVVLLDVSAGHVAVRVQDGSDAPPLVKPPTQGEAGGFGVRLVDQMADRWGVEIELGVGKSVWFSLDLEPAPTTGGC